MQSAFTESPDSLVRFDLLDTETQEEEVGLHSYSASLPLITSELNTSPLREMVTL